MAAVAAAYVADAGGRCPCGERHCRPDCGRRAVADPIGARRGTAYRDDGLSLLIAAAVAAVDFVAGREGDRLSPLARDRLHAAQMLLARADRALDRRAP